MLDTTLQVLPCDTTNGIDDIGFAVIGIASNVELGTCFTTIVSVAL